VGVEGKFEESNAVSLCDRSGKEIARGITNYNHSDIEQILGANSQDIAKILGAAGENTVVHRDNLVIV
jgi:glutamate 5-kinase